MTEPTGRSRFERHTHTYRGTLLDELERRGGRYGLAALCVGGGMGIATVIERV